MTKKEALEFIQANWNMAGFRYGDMSYITLPKDAYEDIESMDEEAWNDGDILEVEYETCGREFSISDVSIEDVEGEELVQFTITTDVDSVTLHEYISAEHVITNNDLESNIVSYEDLSEVFGDEYRTAFTYPAVIAAVQKEINKIDAEIVRKAMSFMGKKKSQAKATSSRENGKKGGRPKKIAE